MSDLLSLKDRVFVITGSTRGTGLATARMFAEHGARLVITSRKADACAAVAEDLVRAGADAVAIPANIGRREDGDRLIAEAVRHFGGIDGLVLNAAINPVFSDMIQLEDQSWDKILETNLTANWRLSKAAISHMARRGGGAIVIVGSILGHFAMKNSGAYGVAKTGLFQLARQLASEVGPQNIRVNTVSPGAIRTEMIRTLIATRPDWEADTIARAPLRRMAEPEDVAAAILFMASDASRHITGQDLVIDGGTTIQN